ncbi:MAG: YitT family protein [Bacteroidetes bacterium]|nr:YitT family protein [Bacteroidota bacterium]
MQLLHRLFSEAPADAVINQNSGHSDSSRSSHIEFQHEVLEIFTLLLGIASTTFGLAGFLIPNSFIDGGIVGVSLIATELTNIEVSWFIIIFNLPFVVLAYSVIGKKFAMKSVLGITLLSIGVHFFHFPSVTEDPILVAAFGGFFVGLGIGLAIRGGAILDGTEVLAIYLSRKTSLSVGNVILIFNLIIFSVVAYIFSTEIALYAILTYFAASRTIDFVIDGIEEYIGVTIISEKSEEMRLAITESMGRGCTIYRGRRGYSKNGEDLQETDIVYTVITRLEMARLKTELEKVDEEAFIIMSSIKDTKGGMIKKKPIKKIH